MKGIHLFICFVLLGCRLSGQSLLVETELFRDKGGWVVDAQFIDQMGSPYLLAHGLGKPVEDASTNVTFPETGRYHFWVRTKDWAPFPEGPGKFQVWINGKAVGDFGSSGIPGWRWYRGGAVHIPEKETEIRLKDLTGFEGRCDAIYFSKSGDEKMPENLPALDAFRETHFPVSRHDEGRYDLVVVGGGVAGICAAVQASRLGLKVALINNRPVLGGNSSSEVRVSMDGDVFQNKYPALGRIVREIDNYHAGIGGQRPELYQDDWRRKVVLNEPNLSLFENMHVRKARKKGDRIVSVTTVNLTTLEEHTFTGDFFADCTGDAGLGLLAGADHRYGRESKSETGERSAPETADDLVMGTSNQWFATKQDSVTAFPVEPWMLQFSEAYHFELTRSVWNWETGFKNFHTVNQAEEVRDHNFRAIYGNWAYLKSARPEKYRNYRLDYLSHVTGKRESYRLMGDLVLNQTDIEQKIEYDDALVTTTWGIDLHYPDKKNSVFFPGNEFVAYADHPFKQKDVYTIPYRCLYSRNVENLFMAGRNISVTHIALGTVRVQRCTGMMGEAVGIAAWFCVKKNCSPRNVYQHYLDELLSFVAGLNEANAKESL